MRAVRVLVAVQPPLYSERLQQQIEMHPYVETVGHASSPSQTLLMAAESLADIVLLPGRADDRVPGLCSHLLYEFPEMVAVAISPIGRHAMVYRQTISAEKVEGIAEYGLTQVLSDIWKNLWE